jgi:hypothetical protein
MTRFYRNSIFSSRLFSENILKLLPLLLTGGIMLLINACEEDPSKIGSKLLPGSDYVLIKSTDTMSVRSYTMYTDSIPSDNPAISYLGSLNDPYFGTTIAEFVSQIRPVDSLTTENYLAVDSVKLYLRLLTVSGDTTADHYLKFSEISQQIYTTSKYYSNQIVPLTGKNWTVALPTLRADTINEIVVKIDTSFGSYLTREKSMVFINNNKPDFRSYFKGLYFQIISTGSPIFTSLSVTSPGFTGISYNYFTVYMHDENASSKSYDFRLDAKASNAAYNLFGHDFNTAEPGKKIQHINDMYPDTLSYLQKLNGVFTKIDIPYLKLLKNDPLMKNIAVNKARLIIPFVTETPNPVYLKTIPSIVYLRYLTSKGTKYIVRDADVDRGPGAIFYDGRPDTTTAFSYNINIATYLQDYLDDTSDSITTDLELFLLPTSTYNAVLRANKSNKPVKFELTYTKF